MRRKLGWHILGISGRLKFDDGREVRVGAKLEAHEVLRPWDRGVPAKVLHIGHCGMHASERLGDALTWHPYGAGVVCRVQVSDEIYCKTDQFVGRYRRVLWAVRLNVQEYTDLVEIGCFCQDEHRAWQYLRGLGPHRRIVSGSLVPVPGWVEHVR